MILYLDASALKLALRGYDAVHIASAVIVGEQGNQAVRFACFDDTLSRLEILMATR